MEFDRERPYRRFRQIDLLVEGRLLIDRQNPMNFYNDEHFRQRYRFKKLDFLDIFREMEDALTRPIAYGSPLPPLHQLMIAMRFFATNSFQKHVGDTQELQVSQATVSRVVRRVARAIALQRGRFIKFPSPAASTRFNSRFFQKRGFPGVVGAIDCTHIRIRNPSKETGEVYRNRKGFHSINAQVVAGPDYKIISATVQWPGSCHDARIFDNSTVREVMEAGDHGHLIGDSAYPCRRYILTPLRNPVTNPERQYNYSLSATRMTVECCFGAMKRKFPCLSQELRLKNIQDCIHVIVACMILYNIAVDRRDIHVEPNLQEDNVLANMPDDPSGVAKRQRIINTYFAQG